MASVKILVVGPKACGKSTLANFLADYMEKPSGDYRPTKGCRIHEFERDIPSQARRGPSTVRVAVELWDVSGDRNFQPCWPAILRDVNGILFVYNPEEKSQQTEVSEVWYKQFVAESRLRDNQCLCFAHRGSSFKRVEGQKLAGRVTQVYTNLDENPQAIKESFDQWLVAVMDAASQAREHDENEIVGNR
eukprot:tig00020902_g14999.t1